MVKDCPHRTMNRNRTMTCALLQPDLQQLAAPERPGCICLECESQWEGQPPTAEKLTPILRRTLLEAREAAERYTPYVFDPAGPDPPSPEPVQQYDPEQLHRMVTERLAICLGCGHYRHEQLACYHPEGFGNLYRVAPSPLATCPEGYWPEIAKDGEDGGSG